MRVITMRELLDLTRSIEMKKKYEVFINDLPIIILPAAAVDNSGRTTERRIVYMSPTDPQRLNMILRHRSQQTQAVSS